jgi:hypothetical protein
MLVAVMLLSLATVIPALAVAPAADFNGTPTTGCSPVSVYFVDMSTGTLFNQNWTFGDGGTATNLNPTHTYTVAAGTGTMTYTVVHGVNATAWAGSDIETKTAYISVNGDCHTPIDPNVIDFANISSLIGNIAGIFPGIISLVVGILPLYIVQGLIYLFVGLFSAILVSVGKVWRG